MIFINRPPKAKQSKPAFIKFVPNCAGQGGVKYLTFKTDEGRTLIIRFETAEEVRELLSQAHIIHHNFNDPRMP